MGLEQLGIETIEQLLAAVPQLVVLLTTLVYTVKTVKAKIGEFPQQAQKYQGEITKSFSEMREDLTVFVKTATTSFASQVKQLKDDLTKQVGEELTNMKSELADYQKTLENMVAQNNLLVKQNKLYMDVVASLISQDPQKIRDGIATIICAKTNLTKEQLEHYPDVLSSEIKILAKAMKETLMTIGVKEFDELLRSIGYVKATQETKKTEL